jgi:hypothetical protein
MSKRSKRNNETRKYRANGDLNRKPKGHGAKRKGNRS